MFPAILFTQVTKLQTHIYGIRYASGSLDEVKNFLQWARENGEKMHEFSVVEAAGDQLIGGNEKEIPQDLLRNL